MVDILPIGKPLIAMPEDDLVDGAKAGRHRELHHVYLDGCRLF